jgi:heterodisulfide reductase subunit A-like polyferredoxin
LALSTFRGNKLLINLSAAMASAKVTLGLSPKMMVEETEMVIVGGGICGILAAKQCHDRGMKYVVIEKEAKLGGVWHTMANGTSFLQVSIIIFS